jgi:hypothetical protein
MFIGLVECSPYTGAVEFWIDTSGRWSDSGCGIMMKKLMWELCIELIYINGCGVFHDMGRGE